jgi:HSP20 family protein
MADLSKWASSDVLEPIRRFLEGDMTMSAVRVEQFLDGDTLVVRAELPGIDPDTDVDLSVTDGQLHIKAKREEKAERKSKTGYRSEFRYGSVTRSFALPPGVSEEDITASYNDGVLEVRAPVRSTSPDTSAKRIRIDRG